MTQEFKSAGRIGLFAPLQWEIDLRRLWELSPEKCSFPKVQKNKIDMTFYKVNSLLDLSPGYGGILEPSVSDSLRVQDWSRDDLILIPALSYDLFGHRLGSGQGYYDRYIEKHNSARRWGVCYDEQVSTLQLPQEPHDLIVQAICTPSGIKEL